MRKQRKRRRQNVRLAGVPCSDTLLDLQLMKIHFLECANAINYEVNAQCIAE